MINSETVRATLRLKAKPLREFGVSKLSLFGSAARGETQVNDLDFLVEFAEPPGLEHFMNLKFFLEECFQLPVDLHSSASCPDRFYKRIAEELEDVA